METFQALDWAVVALYFAVVMGIAVRVMRKRAKDSADYFLASRHVGWYVIGSSILASNVGSEHIVGLAGTGASSGVPLGQYELHSWCVLLLGWVFVPFYLRSRVFTMPEFLELRYTPKARWFLSVISIIAYVLTKVSVTVYAGAIVFQSLMGVEFWTSALVVVLLTGLYTMLGGLRAIVYTDAVHVVVLILGSITVTIVGIVEVGGWDNVLSTVGKDHLNMWPPLDSSFPWLGLLLTGSIVGIWYWCTDQCIVQRTLAAKDEANARRGTIFAGYLKLLPFFIFLVPGIIAFALNKQGKLYYETADQVFPTMVRTLIPVGVRGLIAGGLIAALMSSLAAVFNGCSTLFTMDIYKKLRPEATEATLVRVGRIATTVVVALGIAWIPVLKGMSEESSLYKYLQNVQAYIAPPITAVFLLGVFFKRINGKGALSALIAGFLLGMSKLAVEVFPVEGVPFLHAYARINFLYFAPVLFLIAVAIMTIVSLLTEIPSEQRLRGLTYATTLAQDRALSRASWSYKEVIHTAIIISVIVLIMIYFSPLGVAG